MLESSVREGITTKVHFSSNFTSVFVFACRVFGSFKNGNDRETVYAWFTFSHWLIYANSAANPIIYNFLSGEFVVCCNLGSLLPSSGQVHMKVCKFLI